MSRRRRGGTGGMVGALRPESRRIVLSLIASLALGAIVVLTGPLARLRGEQDGELATVLFALVLVVSIYALVYAGLTWSCLRRLPRRELLVTARLGRARQAVRWYRWLGGRAGVGNEALQLVVVAGLAILLFSLRPTGLGLLTMLLLTTLAIGSAWIGCTVAFAVEYAAEDAHEDAFTTPGAETDRRTFEDYLHLAILVQTTNGPADILPCTRSARRLVRVQSVLAYIMSTVILAVGVSVLLTAL